MADHMRRNDKLQALTADASRANARKREGSTAQDGRPNATPTPRAPRERREAPARKSLGTYIKENVVYILPVAAVIILFVLMIFFLRACAPTQDAPSGEDAQAYASPYDWTKLDRTNGRYAYVVNGQVKSRLGIDVSESQGSIDWQAVAADGIDFAMIRLGYRGATEGDLYLDSYYQDNIAGAREAGLDCGIYFFSQAITTEEAVEEAEFVLDYLGGTSLEYPIAFDSEVVTSLDIARTANLSSDEMTAVADAFCERLERAGYSTLVYGNTGDLGRYNDSVVNDGGIWWAEYGSSMPNHYLDIVMWQYSNAGSVAGVATNVDMNIDLSKALA